MEPCPESWQLSGWVLGVITSYLTIFQSNPNRSVTQTHQFERRYGFVAQVNHTSVNKLVSRPVGFFTSEVGSSPIWINHTSINGDQLLHERSVLKIQLERWKKKGLWLNHLHREIYSIPCRSENFPLYEGVEHYCGRKPSAGCWHTFPWGSQHEVGLNSQRPHWWDTVLLGHFSCPSALTDWATEYPEDRRGSLDELDLNS